jgi:hypothetical protein
VPFAPVELRVLDAPEFVVVPSVGTNGKSPGLVIEKPEANEMSQDEAREDAVIPEKIDQRRGC